MSTMITDSSNYSAIADAIREKNGETTTYKPSEMASKIKAIEGSGGSNEILITGNAMYALGYNVLNNYIDQIITKDLSTLSNMCQNSTGLTDLSSLVFNMGTTPASGTTFYFDNGFYNCTNLTKLPKIILQANSTGAKIGAGSMFYGCFNLKEIPDDFITNPQELLITSGSSLFGSCLSLRKLPSFVRDFVRLSSLSSLFYQCASLDTIDYVPVDMTTTLASSAFATSTFQRCCRVMDILFPVQEDGTPYSVSWGNNTIDFSYNVGYANNTANILNYNSGITEDKQVKNDESYQALKDDPDWFTLLPAYSRYNHDSAVRTLKSLPIMTNTNTHTIKFLGESGSATDGGAINTLTDEEIQIATDKGWTVSIS